MISLPNNIVCGYYDSGEFNKLTKASKRKVQKFEIEFYLEDAYFTYADNKKYAIKKHYIQIAKPGQIRYTDPPYKTMYLKFSVEGEIAEKLSKVQEYFRSSHPEKIIEKLNEIILLNENKNNDLLLYSRLLSFINLVLYDSEIPNLQSGKNYEIISNAKRFIENNYKNSINLKNIADSVNLSPIYFHNFFTNVCGVSPHDYLIDCRIKEAKKQLWDSDKNLDFIAQNCGFGCAQYFSRIFKKITGITPGKYRKEVQQNYLED